MSKEINDTIATLSGTLGSRAAIKYDPWSVAANKYLKTTGVSPQGGFMEHAIERLEIIEGVVKQWIINDPNASFLNLGAGLCSRFLRLDNGSITWTDVDFPKVGEWRADIFPSNPRQNFLGMDLNKEFLETRAWDYIIAEGCFMYLEQDVVRTLMNNYVICDLFGPRINKPAQYKWYYNAKEWDFEIEHQWQIWEPRHHHYVMQLRA